MITVTYHRDGRQLVAVVTTPDGATQVYRGTPIAVAAHVARIVTEECR